MSLHPSVVRARVGTRPVLWQPLLGRGLAVHPETLERLYNPPLPAALARRFASLGLLDGSLPDRRSMVPVRLRGVTLWTERSALWRPDPTRPGDGGFSYVAQPLSDTAIAVWMAIDDVRTVEAIAVQTSQSVRAVLATLDAWMTLDVQAVQLRPTAPRVIDPSLIEPLSAPRPDIGRDRMSTGTDLTAYHLSDITDGSTHFDDRETTVAHVHAVPHPALGGERYGQRLAPVIGPVHDDAVIVEVGCGTGELARDLTPLLAGTYLRIDLSPVLLRHQATQSDTLGVLGDALRLPLRDASVDRLISNEVLADLPSEPHTAPGVADACMRYGICAWSHAYNTGTWRFLEEIARVLTPGGRAWVSEFGTLDAPPEEATQLDHPEVSIVFTHLEAVARSVGLVPTLRPMGDWLGLDRSALHLSRPSWHALRSAARCEGTDISSRARHPSEPLPGPSLHPMHWTTVVDPGCGPLWSRFWGLLLEKPWSA